MTRDFLFRPLHDAETPGRRCMAPSGTPLSPTRLYCTLPDKHEGAHFHQGYGVFWERERPAYVDRWIDKVPERAVRW